MGGGERERRLFVAVALKPRPVAIHLSRVAVNGGVAPVELRFLFVITVRPAPRRTIVPTAFFVVFVRCLVVLYIGALFLVRRHTASFH